MAGPTLTDVIIDAGQSLSRILDITQPATGITRIICPDDWSLPEEYGAQTPLSFQWSPNGTYFYDLFDMATGKEILIPMVANAVYVLPNNVWRSGYVKFRSGSARTPVAQAAERIFKCVIE